MTKYDFSRTHILYNYSMVCIRPTHLPSNERNRTVTPSFWNPHSCFCVCVKVSPLKSAVDGPFRYICWENNVVEGREREDRAWELNLLLSISFHILDSWVCCKQEQWKLARVSFYTFRLVTYYLGCLIFNMA